MRFPKTKLPGSMDKDEIFVPRTKRDPELYLRFSDGAMRFIYHPTFSPSMYGKEGHLRKTLDWPQKTELHCIHCCEQFDAVPVPVPLTYDVETGRIEVAAGVCCCITCLKGHLQESPQFNTPYRLALTKLMAIEVFGVSASVMKRVAPPRIALKKFGGPMTLEEFRVGSVWPILLRAAPFICRDMIFEEQQNYEEKRCSKHQPRLAKTPEERERWPWTRLPKCYYHLPWRERKLAVAKMLKWLLQQLLAH